MANSAFTQSSDAEQQYLPPESARRPLWPWFLILGAVALVLVVWAGIPQGVEGPDDLPIGERHPAVGATVTHFHLEPLTGEGRSVSEADLTAAATLINFWGPWCGACVIEFPHLVELEQHFRSEPGFQFFSVSTNEASNDVDGLAESTTQFLKHFKAEFPTYYDPKKETTIALVEAAKIEGFGYPTTVLLGSGGVIRGVWPGYHVGDEIKIREAIEKALRENGDLP